MQNQSLLCSVAGIQHEILLITFHYYFSTVDNTLFLWATLLLQTCFHLLWWTISPTDSLRPVRLTYLLPSMERCLQNPGMWTVKVRRKRQTLSLTGLTRNVLLLELCSASTDYSKPGKHLHGISSIKMILLAMPMVIVEDQTLSKIWDPIDELDASPLQFAWFS